MDLVPLTFHLDVGEGVDRLWEICQPVLDNPPTQLPYARGSWGPDEAIALAGREGWRLPAIAHHGLDKALDEGRHP